MNISLEVPENSVDNEVYLRIILDNGPKNKDSDENIIIRVLSIKPYGIIFKIPAILTVGLSDNTLSDPSSIAMKRYEHKTMEWVTFPHFEGVYLIFLLSYV